MEDHDATIGRENDPPDDSLSVVNNRVVVVVGLHCIHQQKSWLRLNREGVGSVGDVGEVRVERHISPIESWWM